MTCMITWLNSHGGLVQTMDVVSGYDLKRNRMSEESRDQQRDLAFNYERMVVTVLSTKGVGSMIRVMYAWYKVVWEIMYSLSIYLG